MKSSVFRRPQFSLRSILIVVALLGLVLGRLAMSVHLTKRSHAAARRLVAAGYLVGESAPDKALSFPWDRGISRITASHSVDWKVFRDESNYFTYLESGTFAETSIRDEDLASLRDCRYLKLLDVEFTGVTAQGLLRLAASRRLESILLAGTGICDHDLDVLRVFPNIRSISIDGCQATRLGMDHLGRLEHLRDVHLSGNEITDETLHLLLLVPRLSSITLNNSRITEDGLKWLAENLPSIQVGEGAIPVPPSVPGEQSGH